MLRPVSPWERAYEALVGMVSFVIFQLPAGAGPGGRGVRGNENCGGGVDDFNVSCSSVVLMLRFWMASEVSMLIPLHTLFVKLLGNHARVHQAVVSVTTSGRASRRLARGRR